MFILNCGCVLSVLNELSQIMMSLIEASIAALIIDSYNSEADADIKKTVSCRMVIRTLDTTSDIPLGASQGSMTGLGYSQSWTIGSGGGAGELYLSKLEKKLLGAGNAIGSYSPVQELAGSSS